MDARTFQTGLSTFTCVPQSFLAMLSGLAETLEPPEQLRIIDALEKGEKEGRHILDQGIHGLLSMEHALKAKNLSAHEEADRRRGTLPPLTA